MAIMTKEIFILLVYTYPLVAARVVHPCPYPLNRLLNTDELWQVKLIHSTQNWTWLLWISRNHLPKVHRWPDSGRKHYVAVAAPIMVPGKL